MIVIYTGIEEIDKEIQMNLRDSIVAHYSDYLIENNKQLLYLHKQ